jgi:hypothetical protein
MLLHSTGKEKGAPFYTANLEGFGEKKIEGQDIFPVASLEEPAPPVFVPVPAHSSSKTSQSKKERHSKKEYLKQMLELAEFVQCQNLENKKLEKLLSDSKRKSLQLSLALSQQQEISPSDPWDTFVTSEVTGSYYEVARGNGLK